MVCVYDALHGGGVVKKGKVRFTELCNDSKYFQLVWL